MTLATIRVPEEEEEEEEEDDEGRICIEYV